MFPLAIAQLLLLAGAGADPPQAIVAIPVEVQDSTILMPLRVNGSAPLAFILDSGGNTCLLDKGRATALGLKPTGEEQGSGAGAGTVSFWRFEESAVSLAVAGIDFRCSHVGAVDLSSGQLQILGRQVDGVLGTDFFERFVVEIDYEAGLVRLYDPASYVPLAGGDELPLSFERRLPYVTAKLTVKGGNPTDRKLLVDTGSQDGIDDDLVSQSQAPRREVIGGVGLGQEFRIVLGRIETVQLGRFGLEAVPGASGKGLLGGEVLRRFTVTFDFPRKRMRLEPNTHLRDAFPTRSGLDLRLASDRGGLVVHDVDKGSAAEQAGLRSDDLITALDGAPSAELGLSRVARSFVAGRTYRLTVKRGGETLVLRFSPSAEP